jgi:gamma-glutamyltranspeptidase
VPADRPPEPEQSGARLAISSPERLRCAIHGLGAALPWEAALAPAIRLAGGVRVTRGLGTAIADALDAVFADPGMAAVFAPGGRALAAGDVLRQPALAATLRSLAADGPGAFYAGPLSRAPGCA